MARPIPRTKEVVRPANELPTTQPGAATADSTGPAVQTDQVSAPPAETTASGKAMTLADLKPFEPIVIDGVRYTRNADGIVVPAESNTVAKPFAQDRYYAQLEDELRIIQFLQGYAEEFRQLVRRSDIFCDNPRGLLSSLERNRIPIAFPAGPTRRVALDISDIDGNGRMDFIKIFMEKATSAGATSFVEAAVPAGATLRGDEYDTFAIPFLAVGVQECVNMQKKGGEKE